MIASVSIIGGGCCKRIVVLKVVVGCVVNVKDVKDIVVVDQISPSREDENEMNGGGFSVSNVGSGKSRPISANAYHSIPPVRYIYRPAYHIRGDGKKNK